MKILDIINKVDVLKPNRYDLNEKIDWINTLEARIKEEIINTHEGSDGLPYVGIIGESAADAELLAPPPHSEMYLYWLEAQIDYWNGETKKYNNSIEMFDAAYKTFSNHYNRTHMPKGRKK